MIDDDDFEDLESPEDFYNFLRGNDIDVDDINKKTVETIRSAFRKGTDHAFFNHKVKDNSGKLEMSVVYYIPKDSFMESIQDCFDYFREQDDADMQIDCWELLQEMKKDNE
jgi:hypothetical protein